jgi:hypothetical protein
VACSSAEACTAIGLYDGTAVIDDFTAGQWINVTGALPADSASPPISRPSALACKPNGPCTIIGEYTTRGQVSTGYTARS